MSHNTKPYLNFQKRMYSIPHGIIYSNTLIKIFKLILTDREADLASKVPMRIFDLEEASIDWHLPQEESKKVLYALSDKGILMNFEVGDKELFHMNPFIPGFFELVTMRCRDKPNSGIIFDLFFEYIHNENKEKRRLPFGQISSFRAMPYEDVICGGEKVEILDYEKVSHIIDNAKVISVSDCACRHLMAHKNLACDSPMETCFLFDFVAENSIKNNLSRKIDKEEAHEIIKKCEEAGLVHCGENVQEGVKCLCNCCSCCCIFLKTCKHLGVSQGGQSNYMAQLKSKECSFCGLCVQKCPMDAIQIKEKNGQKKIEINLDKCLGCGICVKSCSSENISLVRKKDIEYIPKDSFELYVKKAVLAGKLQNLIFDNYSLWTYDLLRKMFQIIFSPKFFQKKFTEDKFVKKFTNTYSKSQRRLIENYYNKKDEYEKKFNNDIT